MVSRFFYMMGIINTVSSSVEQTVFSRLCVVENSVPQRRASRLRLVAAAPHLRSM